MSSPVSSGQPARRLFAALLVAVLPFFSGCWLSGHQSTFDTKGPVAESQLHVFYVTLWVTLPIFIVVAGVFLYALWKFRAKTPEEETAYTPEQGHGNPLVEIGLIAGSVLALVIIAVPTLKAIWYTYDVPAEQRDDALEIVATGYQWWFKFDYPTEMAPQSFGGEAPVVTANELVIPVNRPVHIELRTVDVIHSFWVPKLAGKVDMMPNRGNHLWLEADEAGYYWGQCAEYCGESHAVMRFRVIALEEDDYNQWLSDQKQMARTVEDPGSGATAEFASYQPFSVNQKGWTEEFDADPLGNWMQKQEIDAGEDPALIARGRQYFQENQCAGCHTVRGHEGGGVVAPDLTHIGSRTTIAGGLLENSKENLYRWITEPQNVKPGNYMYHTRRVQPAGMVVMNGYTRYDTEAEEVVSNIEVTPEEAHALVAYLHSLK